ncbi:hypothetical protein EJD97_011273, partial [Solanum chilense]
KDKKEDNKRKEQARIAIEEAWDTIPLAQIIRGYINQIINESFRQIESGNWPNSSLIETKMKDLTDRTSTIKNQIERITKEKKKVTPEIDINPNKTNNIKKFESPKKIFQILKSRNTRVIWKFHYFLKLFIQRLYINLFLSII